jgi:hypothetical protein
VKKLLVKAINNRKFDDTSWYGHVDRRIVAVVAGVPFAADFDPDSLRQPEVALALISVQNDRWLVPRFHSGAVTAACRTCEHLLDLAPAGHGALLAPLPPAGSASGLVLDPPGFNRQTEVPRINGVIIGFLQKALAETTR